MKKYANIDSIERVTRRKFSLKKNAVIILLTAGVGAAAISSINKSQSDNKPSVGVEQQSSSKVFKSYEIKAGDTLTSIVEKIMKEYPNTADYYTEAQLIKEVASINNMGTNLNNIQTGNYLIVPYYMPTVIIEDKQDFYDSNDMEASTLDDYEDYVVNPGDSYWKIACMYTNDDSEIVDIVKKIQDLNGNQDLMMGSTIKIPNLEKYKMQHAEYVDSTWTR